MLKVEQYFEEQKNKAVKKAVEEAVQATTEKMTEMEKETARKMFLDGMELSQVVRYVKLPRQELEQLLDEL